MTDAPLSVFRSSARPREIIDWISLFRAHGTWSLLNDGSINFEILPDDNSTAFGSISYTTGSGAGMELVEYVGNNDNDVRLVLTRKK